jgi:hypothetical protein
MSVKPTKPSQTTQDKMQHNLVSFFGMKETEAARLIEEVVRGGGSPDDIVNTARHAGTISDFEETHKGYDDYVLFVDELFSEGLEDQAARFVHFVHLRYDGFENYPVDFDKKWVKDSDFNPLLNELYAPRNVDLLMNVCPELEERLVSQKDKHQQKIYTHAKRRDPEIALKWLVNHKKRSLPVHHQQLMDDMQVLIKMKRTIDERNPISKFIAKKSQNTFNVLDALAMRGVLTPMGVYPAKAILENTVSYIHQLVQDKRISSMIKPMEAAQTRDNLLTRLSKFKGKLIASLAASALIFSTANLQNTVDLNEMQVLIERQQKVATSVQLQAETQKTPEKTEKSIVEQWCVNYAEAVPVCVEWGDKPEKPPSPKRLKR